MNVAGDQQLQLKMPVGVYFLRAYDGKNTTYKKILVD